ncbi:MAG: hypothetical protein LBN08_05315 [Lactobacillales bacterium]|jgi:hypothetical protein|nr:hypothetical protein [Lactobacillales bacterium]
MTLDVDKQNMTIMGVRFTNKQEFRVVWYAISSNMIEGWNPTKEDVKNLQRQANEMRLVTENG